MTFSMMTPLSTKPSIKTVNITLSSATFGITHNNISTIKLLH
jgi:hypothetical protein